MQPPELLRSRMNSPYKCSIAKVRADGQLRTEVKKFYVEKILTPDNLRRIDIYSLGCMMFEILCHEPPVPNESKVGSNVMKRYRGWTANMPVIELDNLEYALQDEHHPMPKVWRIPTARLILKMLSPCVNDRPLIDEVIQELENIHRIKRHRKRRRKSRRRKSPRRKSRRRKD